MSSENMLFDAEQAKNEALDMEYREQIRIKELDEQLTYEKRLEDAEQAERSYGYEDELIDE